MAVILIIVLVKVTIHTAVVHCILTRRLHMAILTLTTDAESEAWTRWVTCPRSHHVRPSQCVVWPHRPAVTHRLCSAVRGPVASATPAAH